MLYVLLVILFLYTLIKIQEKKIKRKSGIFLISVISGLGILLSGYYVVSNIEYQSDHAEISHFYIVDLEDNLYSISRPTTNFKQAVLEINDDLEVDKFEAILGNVNFKRVYSVEFLYSHYIRREGIEVNIRTSNHLSYHMELLPNIDSDTGEIKSYDYYIYDNNDYYFGDLYHTLLDKLGIGYTINANDSKKYTLNEEDGELVAEYVISIISSVN